MEFTNTLIKKVTRRTFIYSFPRPRPHLILVTLQTGLLTSIWATTDLFAYLLVVRLHSLPICTSRP